jgi:hypothetical protein
MVKVEPVPFMKSGYAYGGRTPGEDALLRRMDAGARQTEMNKTHAGGGQIIVPQIYTGASSDGQLNEHIKNINGGLMEQQENSRFDKLALYNKTGGRKRKSGRKTKKTKKTRKSSRKQKKTMKSRK